MKISIASYAFHGLLASGMMDIFGYLETCKYRFHLSSADIWNGFLPNLTGDSLEKVKTALRDRDLELANLCVDGAHIWDEDEAVREQNYKNALANLHAGEVLGARTIRIDAGGHAETWTNQQFDLIVRRYREFAKRAYDNGYKVGPENHWGTEVDPHNMISLCEAVDHPAFGVLLHFRGNEGDALMAPFAMHTHISWDIAEGSPESLAMLASTGYQGYWGVEHHSGENEYSKVAIQLARVQDAVRQLS